MSCRYRVYGLNVDSDVQFPSLRPRYDMSTPPDVVVSRARDVNGRMPSGPVVASISCPVHGVDMEERRSSDEVRVWLRSFGHFHLTADGHAVTIFTEECADDRDVGLALSGPILLLARHLRGEPSLHASSVVLGQRAVGFLGNHEAGKSTMAAAFLRRRASLLTDDALPLRSHADGIYAYPGLPHLKVWDATARHSLDLPDALPILRTDVDKRLLTLEGRYEFTHEPVRLDVLYVLHRYDPEAKKRRDIRIVAMSRREALVSLLPHLSVRAYLVPSDEVTALPVLTRLVSDVPVRLLSYPEGFEYQEAVYDRVRQDLEST